MQHRWQRRSAPGHILFLASVLSFLCLMPTAALADDGDKGDKKEKVTSPADDGDKGDKTKKVTPPAEAETKGDSPGVEPGPNAEEASSEPWEGWIEDNDAIPAALSVETEDVEAEIEPPVQALKGLALFVLPNNDKSADGATLLQDMFRAQLLEFPGVELRSLAEAPRSIAPQVAPTIEDGFRALNSKEGKKAAALFKSALERLKAHTGRVDRRLMAQAMKGLAVSHVMNGDLTTARGLISGSLNMWPEQKAVEYAYDMDAFHLFGYVTKMRETAPRGSLNILSETPGATVFLDGKKQGETPQELRGLLPGPHWIEVEAAGHVRAVMSIAIAANAPIDHEVKLAKAPSLDAATKAIRALAATTRKKNATPLASGLLESLGADQAIVLTATARRNRFDIRGWNIGPEGPVAIRKKIGDNLIEELNAILSESFGLTAPPEGDAESVSLGGPPTKSLVEVTSEDGTKMLAPKPAVEENFYETWWFWTAAGGVVATAVGVAIAVVLSAEPDVPRGDLGITLNRVPQR